jgi:predicted transposase YdaD
MLNAFVALKDMRQRIAATVEHYIASQSVGIVPQPIENFQVHYRQFTSVE